MVGKEKNNMSDNIDRTITPNPPADFTPSMGNYQTLQPFRYWCQKVLPLVYDDSLSYYELLCKVVDFLNKTMEDVETLHGDVTGLHEAYVKLQGYVNNYFSTLDVQKEINNKLDELVENGTLTQLITPIVDNKTKIYVNNWLNNNITNPTNPPLDKSLLLENSAANSKTVGDFFSMPARGSLGSPNGGSFTGKIVDYSGCFVVWKNVFDALFPNAPIESNNEFVYAYIPKLTPNASFGTNTNSYIIKGLIITSYNKLILFNYRDDTNTYKYIDYGYGFDTTLTKNLYAANSKTVGDFMSMPSRGSLGSSSGGSFTGKISDYSGCFIVWKNAFDVLFPNAPYKLFNNFNYVYAYIPKINNTAKFGANVTNYVIKGFVIIDTNNLFTFSYINDTISYYNYGLGIDASLTKENYSADAKYVGESIKELDSKIANIQPSTLHSPNNTKYKISVTDNGELYTIPIIPNQKVLIIGNSLLLGFGSFGMCASTPYNDYAGILKRYIPNASFEKKSGVLFESAETIELARNWLKDNISGEEDNTVELVLLQLGDNVNTANKQNVFKSSCEELILACKKKYPKAIICWCGLWFSEINHDTIEKACNKYGILNATFTHQKDKESSIGAIYDTENINSITTYNVDSFDVNSPTNITLHFTVNDRQYESTIECTSYTSNSGTSVTVTGRYHVVTNAGVASHPGDSGFTYIANSILKTLSII